MHALLKTIFIVGSSMGLMAMTGCQTFIQKNNPVTQAPEQFNQFNIQGKIGVKTPEQSGSAFFIWQQQQEQFDIELSGILGIGKTQITGQPGQVVLNSAKTGKIIAATPEELLQRATGWQTPITHLMHWVQAKPATTDAQLQSDEQKRTTQIQEDGWTAHLSYNDAARLPYKLILVQALETDKENRITMVIQNR